MRRKLGLALHFGNVPHPWALPLVKKHEPKFIMNQTYVDHQVYEWGGFLCLLLNSARVISRKEIDGHKVPSTYTTNFL
jgi:hypothetical protein